VHAGGRDKSSNGREENDDEGKRHEELPHTNAVRIMQHFQTIAMVMSRSAKDNAMFL